MRKAYRYIALALALCIILGAASVAFADFYKDGGMSSYYDIDAMNAVQMREAFCADARGFLKVLAFSSKERKETALKMFVGAPERTRSVILEQLRLLEQQKDSYKLTQSEVELLAALHYYVGTERLFVDAPSIGNIDELVYAVAAEKDVEYACMLGGRALVERPYSFVSALSEQLEEDLQMRVIERIATFNGKLEGSKIVESLCLLEIYSPDYEEDPYDPSDDVINRFSRDQENLRLAFLEVLADCPKPQLPKESLTAELVQWNENKTMTRTDFHKLIENPAVTDWDALMRGAVLETGPFVTALTDWTPEHRQAFFSAFAEQPYTQEELEMLLLSLHKYAVTNKLPNYRQQVMDELEYMILRQCSQNFPVQTDFSYYIATEEKPSTFLFNDDTFWLCLDAAMAPYGFVNMLSNLAATEVENLSSRIKYANMNTYRQAIVDGVYDLQSQVELSYKEQVAREHLLEHQGSYPSPIYPYGQTTEQPDTTPIDTEPVTEPPLPTDVVTRPTVERTDPIELTQETTAPVQVQEDKKPADTEWISTVCIILGLLCISIVVTTSLAKKKKEEPKQPDPEDPKPEEQPQPVIPQPVAADPNVRCPAPLKRDVQQQIAQALREKYDEYSVNWYSEQNPYGTCRCYGTDGDYHIIFYAGGLRMEISDSCTVGESVFYHGTSFELYAYKDGILTELNIALEKGMVSPQVVKAALAQHEALL